MHCFQGHCPSTCNFCMKKMIKCNVNRTCERTQFNIITLILSTCPIFGQTSQPFSLMISKPAN